MLRVFSLTALLFKNACTVQSSNHTCQALPSMPPGINYLEIYPFSIYLDKCVWYSCIRSCTSSCHVSFSAVVLGFAKYCLDSVWRDEISSSWWIGNPCSNCKRWLYSVHVL